MDEICSRMWNNPYSLRTTRQKQWCRKGTLFGPNSNVTRCSPNTDRSNKNQTKKKCEA